MSEFRFDAESENIEIEVKSPNKFRSNLVLSSALHCFEFTWKSSVNQGYYMIGFSNSETSEEFISYYHCGGEPIFWPRLETTINVGLSINIGETGMVCINSSSNLLTVIKGEMKKEYTMTIYTSPSTTWNVFSRSGGGDAIDILSLNLGKHPFVNVIPTGYSPYISPIISSHHSSQFISNISLTVSFYSSNSLFLCFVLILNTDIYSLSHVFHFHSISTK